MPRSTAPVPRPNLERTPRASRPPGRAGNSRTLRDASSATARIRPLEHDPDLAAAVPDELARRWATRTLVTAAISVPRGPWTTAAERPAGAFGLLVLRGALLAELTGPDHVSARLAGPGDVIAPWADGDDSLLVPSAWRALEPAALAVLDERFTQVSQRCPSLALALVQRMTDCAARDAHLVAALQARRIERRILGLFWHMADRWGRVGTDGVTVSVRATHETLGRLAGAQRSTVTLALRDLSESGIVQRLPDGRWRLAPDSRSVLEAN